MFCCLVILGPTCQISYNYFYLELGVVFIRFLCSDSRLSFTGKIQLHVILNPICQIKSGTAIAHQGLRAIYKTGRNATDPFKSGQTVPIIICEIPVLL